MANLQNNKLMRKLLLTVAIMSTMSGAPVPAAGVNGAAPPPPDAAMTQEVLDTAVAKMYLAGDGAGIVAYAEKQAQDGGYATLDDARENGKLPEYFDNEFARAALDGDGGKIRALHEQQADLMGYGNAKAAIKSQQEEARVQTLLAQASLADNMKDKAKLLQEVNFLVRKAQQRENGGGKTIMGKVLNKAGEAITFMTHRNGKAGMDNG
ncbi:hypothetical protein FACS1894186_0150 [Alphaproteobacteria bacterium]|nr:hypothetical protein FACS1894186_0150 [Alphaproteobacteria bacterium]